MGRPLDNSAGSHRSSNVLVEHCCSVGQANGALKALSHPGREVASAGALDLGDPWVEVPHANRLHNRPGLLGEFLRLYVVAVLGVLLEPRPHYHSAPVTLTIGWRARLES